MLNETTLTQEHIRQWLTTHYGITPDNMTLLAHRGARLRYTFTHQGKHYLLTIATVSPTKEWLKLLQALYYDFSLTQMPPPPIRATTGNHFNPLQGHTGYLQEYPKGQTAQEKPLTGNQYKQLGSLFAGIHRYRLETPPSAETFGADVHALINAVNKRLDAPSDGLTSDQAQVRLWLNDHRGALNDVLEPFKSVHNRLVSDAPLKKRFVMCYGGSALENLLINDNMLNLLYWDTPLYAPAERDLSVWADVPEVLEGYLRMTPTFTPNLDVMAFYEMEGNVRQLATLAYLLLSTPLPAPDFERDFATLKSYIKVDAPAPSATSKEPAPLADDTPVSGVANAQNLSIAPENTEVLPSVELAKEEAQETSPIVATRLEQIPTLQETELTLEDTDKDVPVQDAENTPPPTKPE